MMTIFKKAAVAVLALGASVAMGEVRLQGTGATFPQPLYAKMVAEYQKAHPDILIDYQGIGSGGGIKAITEKTVDWCGSDAPLNKKQLEAMGGADYVVQVPSCAGGVVPAYNVPGVSGEIKFTGPLLADIYLGKVNNWNDAGIAKINPDLKLPNLPITPAWRTDGSGTNFVWTNYLGTQSEDFKGDVGAGTSVKWPIGVGGKGNAGVAAVVQSTPGGLGYLEQAYADQNKITYGPIQNKDGKFVKASPAAVSAAGGGAVDQMKGHVLAANIWSQPGEMAYPAGSFTYLIVYKDLSTNVKTKEQAQALVDFLWWATHDGQNLAPALDYAPLAEGVQKKVEEALGQLTFKGESIKSSGK
jgi:phosphate transport system substrate-binding protein